MKITARLLAFVSILVFFASIDSSQAAQWQQKVGSVHVSVIGVARWDEVKTALQPKFKMDEDTALAKAIPTTLSQYQEILSSIKAALKLVPPASTEASTESASTEGGVTTTKSQSTVETKAGDLSQATAPASAAASRVYDKPPFATPPSAYDPVMVYQNAKTIYQLVSLLNRSISDAAIRNHYDPYIVTLQISLMPFSSSKSYDAYSTISFFSGSQFEGTVRPRSNLYGLDTDLAQTLAHALSTIDDNIDALILPFKEMKESFKTDFRGFVDSNQKKAAIDLANDLPNKLDEAFLRLYKQSLKTPYIVPLLSTDLMEAGSDVVASNTIRQLSLALMAIQSGFGASAGLDKTNQFIRALAGNELNSLLTLGKLTDNTLQVRLGAMLQPPSGKSQNIRFMVPRTHNISLLLLTPKAEPPTGSPKLDFSAIRAISRTVFRDAQNGKELNPRTDYSLEKQIGAALKPYGILPWYEKSPLKYANAAIDCLQRNDFSSFKNIFSKVEENISYESLWLDLAQIWVGSQYSLTTFDLPVKPQIEWPDEDQVVFCNDDLKTKTIAVLKGGRNISTDSVYKAKIAKTKGEHGSTVEKSVASLIADQVEVQNKTNIVITFASLKALGELQEGTLAGLSIELFSKEQFLPPLYKNIRYIPLALPQEPAIIKTGFKPKQNVIFEQKGSGEVEVEFSRPEAGKAPLLRIGGASISAMSLDGILGNPSEYLYPVLKGGTLSLKLDGLEIGTMVKFELLDSDKKPISVFEIKVSRRK